MKCCKFKFEWILSVPNVLLKFHLFKSSSRVFVPTSCFKNFLPPATLLESISFFFGGRGEGKNMKLRKEKMLPIMKIALYHFLLYCVCWEDGLCELVREEGGIAMFGPVNDHI